MSTRSGIPPTPAKRRLTFVLRLWAHGHDEPVWIGEVQDVSTGETISMQGLEPMVDWLRQKLAQAQEQTQKSG